MRHCFHLLLLICFQSLFAQTDEPLYFEKVEGLSQNTVYSITKDKQGFMWIATADGLNRFDGVEMKVYRSSFENQPGKYTGRVIRSEILKTENDYLWFSTDHTLFGFDKKKNHFNAYYFGDTTAAKTVKGLSVEPLLNERKTFWFSNPSYGIIEFNSQTGDYQIFATPADINGKKILIYPKGVYDQNDHLWFCSSNGLLSFNIRNHQWQRYLTSYNFREIAYQHDTLYISTENRLIYFHTKQKTSAFITIDQPNSMKGVIRTLYADRYSTVWAGDLDGNVYSKSGSSNRFKWRGNINGASTTETHYPVYCFYADENGILWVGADVAGLIKATINYSGFNSFPSEKSVDKGKDFFINAIYEDEQDKVWLGVYRKGVLQLDKKTGVTSQVRLPVGHDVPDEEKKCKLIKKDENGNFWIGYAGNLFVRQKGSDRFIRLNIPQWPANFTTLIDIYCIAKYRNKWLMGTTVGLYAVQMKGDQFEILIEPESLILGSIISDIWYNKNDELWLGFESSGILILKNGKITNPDNMLFSNAGIKSFLPDDEHNLVWISTTSGLIVYHLPTKKYKIITEADGLGNSYVYGALKNKDELWISTNKGLSKAILTWKANEIFPSYQFVNFTSSDGLPDNEFNTGAFHKGESGHFYFGTIRGAAWFKPEHVNHNKNLPAVRLLEVKANEDNADTSIAAEYLSSLTLPYYKNNLHFRFRGVEFLDAGNVTYAYKMEGLDNDWIYSGKLNEVRYNRIQPGDYTFRIKAANGAGIWTDKEMQIKISINAPFWQRWWFYTLAAACIAGVLIIITQYISQNRLKEKIRQLEKQKAVEAERNRISKDMHDEIGSGLTRIALMTELMNTQKQLDEKTKREVNEIAGSTRQLVESMSEIIWTLNPHNDKLEDLFAYLREQTTHYFEPLNIAYKINFPDNIPDIKLSNEQRRNLFLVSKEALNNALKHAAATSIEFMAVAGNGKIKFSVSDNGKGIDGGPKRANANGLRNMVQRMKDIGGDIEWISENGKGTIVNYWIDI